MSIRERLLSASMILSLTLLLGRLAGFAREIQLGALFGVSRDGDRGAPVPVAKDGAGRTGDTGTAEPDLLTAGR